MPQRLTRTIQSAKRGGSAMCKLAAGMSALWSWQGMRLQKSWQAWQGPRLHVHAGLGAKASALPWGTPQAISVCGVCQDPCNKVCTYAHTLLLLACHSQAGEALSLQCRECSKRQRVQQEGSAVCPCGSAVTCLFPHLQVFCHVCFIHFYCICLHKDGLHVSDCVMHA